MDAVAALPSAVILRETSDMSQPPLISRSICLPLIGFGLVLFFLVHPWVAYFLWALALIVLLQELVWLAALPVLWIVSKVANHITKSK